MNSEDPSSRQAPVIRQIAMIFKTPIELTCILNRKRWDE